MLDRIQSKVLLAITFTGSLVLGLVSHESTASAYSGGGAFWVCGSWDTWPTGGTKLPDTQWESDCDDLATYCSSLNSSTQQCTYGGGAWGGSCRCIGI